MWSKLSHPNIQPLVGVIMFQGRLGMVSPWMEHGHMRDYVLSYPEVERYGLMLGVAKGVDYLHSFGMVCSFSLLLRTRASAHVIDK